MGNAEYMGPFFLCPSKLTMSKRGGGASKANKFRMTCGLPVAAVMNCADNSGAKNLYIIAVSGWGARLNRLPKAGVGDWFLPPSRRVSLSSVRRLPLPWWFDNVNHGDEEMALFSTLKIMQVLLLTPRVK